MFPDAYQPFALASVAGNWEWLNPKTVDKLPYQFGGQNDWDGWLLEKSTSNIDHLSEHPYANPYLAFDSGKQRFVDVDDALQFKTRRMAKRMGEAFDAWQKYLERMPSLKQRKINFTLIGT